VKLDLPCTAVVTGASQGIGEAIAQALSDAGANTILAGRSIDRLGTVQKRLSTSAKVLSVDLSDLNDIDRFAAEVSEQHSEIGVLINCGGIYHRGSWQESSIEQLGELFRINVLGTYALTKALLPSLIKTRGDVVFVNSSVVKSNAMNVADFAATQHALRGIADALRAELNEAGVRVLSVFPGRTATPRQKNIHGSESKAYRPETLLQPSDVAAMVVACLSLPATAEVTDLHIRPRQKTP